MEREVSEGVRQVKQEQQVAASVQFSEEHATIASLSLALMNTDSDQ